MAARGRAVQQEGADLVAECGGELLGTVMGIICLDIAAACRPFMLIENVVVAERARGRGIGKKLMASVERIAVEGAGRVDVDAVETFEHGQRDGRIGDIAPLRQDHGQG